MLNPFPELLAFSQLAPFVLRVVLGLILLELAYLKFGKEKVEWRRSFQALGLGVAALNIVALVELVAGLMLIFGLYTQIGALIAAILTGIEIYLEWKDGNILKRDIVFYMLLFVIALSLLVTGAGAYAFDIPL